jgi:hypothetical protein
MYFSSIGYLVFVFDFSNWLSDCLSKNARLGFVFLAQTLRRVGASLLGLDRRMTISL